MSNRYVMGMYGASIVAGIWGWNYMQNQNKNMTIDEKYEKYGGDKRRLVEQREQNALMFKKIKEAARIDEEDLVLASAAKTETKLFGKMEGRKNEDVLAERKKSKEAEEGIEEEKTVKKKKKKRKKKVEETTEETEAGAASD